VITFLGKHSVWLTVPGALAIALGVVCAAFLPRTWQRANALSKEPQRLTLDELATRGAGGNPHVIVTDFICGDDYVFEHYARAGTPPPRPDQEVLGQAWVPLFSRSAAQGAGAGSRRPFTVLLETRPMMVGSRELGLLSQQQSMEVLVSPFSSSTLNHEVRSKLAAHYPGTDFATCLLLEECKSHDREDAPVFVAALAVGTCGGLLLGLPALVLGIIWGRARRKQGRSSKSADAEDAAGSVGGTLTT
jgi:hypothetical protein